MNDKINLIRGVTKFVVGTSVASVLAKLLKNNVVTDNPVEKAQLLVTAYVVGGMVSDRAVAWTSHQFDEAVDVIETIKSVKKSTVHE